MRNNKASYSKRLLSVDEVADRIGLARQTIYNQMSKSLFPIKHKKIGRLIRFHSSDVEKYINSLPDLQ